MTDTSFRRCQAPTTTVVRSWSAKPNDDADAAAREDMPFFHHGKRPRFRNYEKFKSPRKRAAILLNQIQNEEIEKSKAAKPMVWRTPFRVGDAIEIKQITHGGVNSPIYEKVRGVVIGIFRKRLDTSVLIRDILYGEPVERRVQLYSPLLLSLTVLERNFVHKGRRKVKRAKLYYLRGRNPVGKCLKRHLWKAGFVAQRMTSHPKRFAFSETRVTKW